MASCFPFMKYIFLLSLFIISFTLIYTTSLEFLGLVLFFVVNTIYSALLGMDLSSFFSDLIRGRGQAQRWVYLLVVIMIIGLGFNFASSVMTMMTLGNLKYQFGSKGEKILFSPDSRKKMDIIEGLFVTAVVLITVVSFRIYFSPTEMVSNVFHWINENVSEFVLKWGHFVMCLVALGLGLTLRGQFDKDKKDNDDPKKEDKYIFSANTDHQGFLINFESLFFILMALVIMAILPSFAGLIGIDFMRDLYTKNEVSLYTVLVLIFTVLGFSITDKMEKYEKDKPKKPYEELIIASYTLFSLFLTVVVLRGLAYFHGFAELSGNGLYDLIRKASILFKSVFDSMNKTIPNLDYFLLAITMFGTVLGLSDKIDEIGKNTANDINNTQTVYYKVLLSIMIIIPGITFLLMFLGYMDSSSEQSFANRIMDSLRGITNLVSLNVVETFSLIKTFLLIMAVIYGGLTINQYVKIRNTVDKEEYRRYHMKDIFGSFIAFLMITVAVSLFNHRSINGIISFLIDYASPLAILIIAALLVVYTNEISILSKKVPIAEVKFNPEEESEKYVNNITKDKATSNNYDGSDKPKI